MNFATWPRCSATTTPMAANQPFRSATRRSGGSASASGVKPFRSANRIVTSFVSERVEIPWAMIASTTSEGAKRAMACCSDSSSRDARPSRRSRAPMRPRTRAAYAASASTATARMAVASPIRAARSRGRGRSRAPRCRWLRSPPRSTATRPGRAYDAAGRRPGSARSRARTGRGARRGDRAGPSRGSRGSRRPPYDRAPSRRARGTPRPRRGGTRGHGRRPRT